MLTARSIDPIIRRALDEDLQSGDITTESCIDAGELAVGEAISRHPMIVCGGLVFQRTFELVDPSLQVERVVADGRHVDSDTVIWRVRGSARNILMAERVALNFTQRMSGVATMAKRYADAVPEGYDTRVVDTRKTTPNLRSLERYAVRTGGAHNHRDNLGSAVMIKDNHILAAGGIATAVARARARAPHTTRIEIEVGSLEELELARGTGADIIMLDNMDNSMVHEAIERVREERSRGLIIEASGGITLERIAELARIGVDVISIGALTHSAPAADISLEFTIDDG